MEQKQVDDGISLLEVLATIIRRRRWVYGSLLVGTLCVAGLFVVLPLLGVHIVGGSQLAVQAAIRTVFVPAELQPVNAFDVPAMVKGQLNNLGLVSRAYEETMATERELALPRPVYNRLVKDYLRSNLKTTIDAEGQSVILVLRVSEENQERGVRFLSRLTQEIRETIRAAIAPVFSDAATGLAMKAKAASEVGASSPAQFAMKAEYLQGLLSSQEFPFTLSGTIEVVEDASGISIGMIALIVFSSFALLGLLLAVSAEALTRTRRDPRVTELFAKAWKRE